MIVVSLSGSASRIDGIVKYVFRGIEPEQNRNATWQQIVSQFGISLTEKDIQFLEQESGDRELSRLYEECEYDMQKFMDCILNSHLVAKANIRGKSLEEYSKAFHENFDKRTYKSASSIGYHHYVLSFSPEEKNLVTKEVLQDFAEQFYSLYGHRTVYVASAHMDENPHIHCLVGSSTYSGRSTSLRKAEFESLKLKLDSFQREKYPELIFSLPQHGKGKSHENEKNTSKSKNENERSSRVALANQCIVTVASSVTSTTELFDTLQQHNYSVYYRSGRPQGLIDNATGMRMRWKNFSVDVQSLLEQEAQEQQKLNILSKQRSTPSKTTIKQVKNNQLEISEEERLLNELTALRSTTTLETSLNTADITQSEPDSDSNNQSEEVHERAYEEENEEGGDEEIDTPDFTDEVDQDEP